MTPVPATTTAVRPARGLPVPASGGQGEAGVGRTDSDAVWKSIGELRRQVQAMATKADVETVWRAIEGVRAEMQAQAVQAARLASLLEVATAEISRLTLRLEESAKDRRRLSDQMAQAETRQRERDRAAGLARWLVTTAIAGAGLVAGWLARGGI